MCHWVAGALLPAAGMAGRQHPLCVAYHCKRRAMFGKLAGVVFGLGTYIYIYYNIYIYILYVARLYCLSMFIVYLQKNA